MIQDNSSFNSFMQGASRVFLTPILPLLDDKSITEIMINGPDKIYIERSGKLQKTNAQFKDSKALEAAANIICQFVGKRYSTETPRVDARLPDGSRVHVIGPPACPAGMSLSIRRFPDKPLMGDDLVRFGSVTPLVLNFLKTMIEMHQNIIVAGGTGSGKTSLLNVLGRYIPPDERLLIIEDTQELQIFQEHVVRLEARPPDEKGRGGVLIRELFHSALRMRPDRIIIGEIRGGEALDLIQAMTSGHSGAMGTVHATRPLDALRRLETLCLYADTGLPLTAVRTQVASALHLIVCQARLKDGSRKIVEVAEVLPLNESADYRVNTLFAYEIDHVDEDTGKIHGALRAQGNLPTFFEHAVKQGYDLTPQMFMRDPELAKPNKQLELSH
ncbi:CpaF family protein [Candidatus Sumerlaeota bacterium]|nr:CpaF family protein [Candidatus Sumerlaeota bacterium]